MMKFSSGISCLGIQLNYISQEFGPVIKGQYKHYHLSKKQKPFVQCKCINSALSFNWVTY